MKHLEPQRTAAVELAEDQQRKRRMANDAGLGDRRLHVCDAAGDMFAADCLGQQVHAVDAVLKRDDDRLRADERR